MTDLRAVDEPGPAVPLPTDLTDERLVQTAGLSGWLSSAKSRIRGGDLGSLPAQIADHAGAQDVRNGFDVAAVGGQRLGLLEFGALFRDFGSQSD